MTNKMFFLGICIYMLVEGFYKSKLELNPNLEALIHQSIYQNKYIQAANIKPYDKQYLGLLYANTINYDNNINQLLVGAGGYGGKTYLGSMLACQYLMSKEKYTCLVTRRNYAELLDTNSIWDNLTDWCCNDNLPKDWKCEDKQNPTPVIESPVGNKIYFKAFDHKSKKQKFKSTSYDRIINDEASELPVEVLQFQYRSLRNTSNLPISLIHLSNPSEDNPKSNEYLINKFVDGSNPYISMDWRDNPFIDKIAYEKSLDELDFISQQYQKYGLWHYKPTVGDLITRDEILRQVLSFNIAAADITFSLIGIDLAGKGKDKFAVSRYDYLNNGLEVITDFRQTSSSMPEDMLYNFVNEHNPNRFNPLTNLIIIEQEGGGSPLYAQRYFQDLLGDFNIPVVLKAPKGNKYQRARPLYRMLKNGQVKINKDCNCLEDFIEESIQLEPIVKVSPNLVDSVTLCHNYLHENILNSGTNIHIGGHIG